MDPQKGGIWDSVGGKKRRGLQGERLKLRTQGYRNRAMAVWMCSVLDWPCLLWPGLGVISHLVWAKERTRKTAAVPVDPELLILLICITLSFSIHTQSSPLSFTKYTQELSQEYLATGLLQHLPPSPPKKRLRLKCSSWAVSSVGQSGTIVCY